VNDVVFAVPPMFPPHPGEETWTLAADWTVVYRGEVYAVPYGFVTDGASIPCVLRPFCGDPMTTPRLYAAIVHDYLYAGGDPEATRADADDLFRDMQISLGVARWRAYVEWAALRLFGRRHWANTDKAEKKEKGK